MRMAWAALQPDDLDSVALANCHAISQEFPKGECRFKRCCRGSHFESRLWCERKKERHLGFCSAVPLTFNLFYL